MATFYVAFSLYVCYLLIRDCEGNGYDFIVDFSSMEIIMWSITPWTWWKNRLGKTKLQLTKIWKIHKNTTTSTSNQELSIPTEQNQGTSLLN